MVYKDWLYLFVALGMCCVHMLTLFLPPVNLEFAFADAARYFSTGNPELLEQYFKYQANTVAVPYAGHLIASVFQIDALYAIRMLSTIGMFLIAYSIRSISIYLKLELNLTWYLLLLLNPLIWTYSGRATADVLPVGFVMIALVILLDSEFKSINVLMSGFVFGLACVFKYHSVLMLPMLFFLLCIKVDVVKALFLSAVVFICAALVLMVFVISNKANFGFYLAPPVYQNIHSLSLEKALSNLVGYVGFALLLVVPVLLIYGELLLRIRNVFSIANRRSALAMTAVYVLLLGSLIASFVVGFYFVPNNGELNFGPLTRWLSPQLSSGLLTMVAFGGLIVFWYFINDEGWVKAKVVTAFGVCIFILFLSMTRPAQRYLIYVLPFIMLLLNFKISINKYLSVPLVCIFLVLNIYLALNQWVTGLASLQMVQELDLRGLIEQTDPCDIEGHVGNYFKANEVDGYRYKVISGSHDEAIFEVSSTSFLAVKNYSLVVVK